METAATTMTFPITKILFTLFIDVPFNILLLLATGVVALISILTLMFFTDEIGRAVFGKFYDKPIWVSLKNN